ncbi:hypothetical protein F4808DRAFT_459881 [Astrocystis sublimbata]|nr:hypothetical protein F4808DRAFT_459881 [Astrocystis sublimbata]
MSAACDTPSKRKARFEVGDWYSLPPELRLMILEIISRDKYPGWGSLACVCKEWKYALERINFQKITLLGKDCVRTLRHIATPERRPMIRHICLEVELPRYTYFCCLSERTWSPMNSGIVTDAIRSLFRFLSRWEPAGSLVLEINAYSPSDREHWFKTIHQSSSDVDHPRDSAPAPAPPQMGDYYHDPQHGWEDGIQKKKPPRRAMIQLFRPLTFKLDEELPRVRAVTSLVIRRQLRRFILPSGLGWLTSHLVGLEHISYEPWIPFEHTHEVMGLCLQSLAHELRANVLETLNSLMIYLDSQWHYAPLTALSRRPNSLPVALATSHICAAVASKRRDLQHVAVSHIIHAEHIFRHCQSTWTWPRLQSLALTSSLLHSRTIRQVAEPLKITAGVQPKSNAEQQARIDELLCDAAAIALRMPQLHTFVIWNGGIGYASAFIYRAQDSRASITWRGTWQHVLCGDVVEAWQHVAAKLPDAERHQAPIEVIHEPLPSNYIPENIGEAIFRLQLPVNVVEPASLWQMRREHFRRVGS